MWTRKPQSVQRSTQVQALIVARQADPSATLDHHSQGFPSARNMRHCPTLVFVWLVLSSFVATECSADFVRRIYVCKNASDYVKRRKDFFMNTNDYVKRRQYDIHLNLESKNKKGLFLVNQTDMEVFLLFTDVGAFLVFTYMEVFLLFTDVGAFLVFTLIISPQLRLLEAQCSVKGGTKKLDKYCKEDYVKDPSLIGADPLQRTCPLVHKREAGQTDGRQLFSNLPNESNISKTLQEYANKSSDWCGWISGALPAFFDLPVTTQPPKDVVQAFLVGVDRPPILLTVCQDAEEAKEEAREEAREFASETASTLTWRLLDFCHLDFLLLPCVVPNNFDLNDLEDEIKKQLQNLSWCHSGPKTLDKNTFPTMKAAANALARSTRVPDLLTTNNETEKMETLVMEEEWGDVLQGHIDTWSGQAKESGGSLQLKLDRDVPFKEKVAAIEAMKRLSVRNSVTVVTPAPDIKLDDCIQRLRKEVADRYNVSLQIKVAPEEPAASDQTANPSEPMSLVQGQRGMETTNRG